MSRPSATGSLNATYEAEFGITLSSRVRLARNLRGSPFPDKAPPALRRVPRERSGWRPASTTPSRCIRPRALRSR